MGVGRISLLYSGWGTRFVDVDNDGHRDLFVAQSHVLDTIEKTSSYLTYKQPPLLLRNAGPAFVSISGGPSFDPPLAARGAAIGDIDNDGDADIVIGVIGGPPVVLRNNGTKNHWIGFSLVGGRSTRDAFGARVIITDESGRRRIFEVTNAGSYLSSSDSRILVGLGTATKVRSVEIRWPGNRKQPVDVSAVDRYYTVAER